MKVEDIKHDVDVIKFMDEYYFKGNRKDTVLQLGVNYLYKSDSLFKRYYDIKVVKYLETLNTPKWLKVDLNMDGKKDLIVNVHIDDYSKVLAFISMNKPLYDVTLLSFKADRFAQHYIKWDKKNKYLLVTAVDDGNSDWDTSYHFIDKFRTDSLVYKNNMFVDYDISEKSIFSIDTLKYKWRGPHGMKYSVTIPKEGKAQLIKYTFDKDSTFKEGFYLYEMDTNFLIPKIFLLAERLPLLKYKENYYPITRPSHGIFITSEIIFLNGRKIKINDKTSTAPFGLQKIYEYINKLIKDERWHLVHFVE
ncbi:MAG: hypothetical protein V4556_10035 [Bacteroidota bacterium]